MNRRVLTAVAGSIAVLAAGAVVLFLQPGPVDCGGIEEVLPPYLRMTPQALVRTTPLTEVDGVVAVEYPQPRGVQINPWEVAWYGLLQADAYCKDHDASRLEVIRKHRDWLSDHLETRGPAGNQFAVITYDFPDPPWTSKAGWGSGLSQAATLALLNRVRTDNRVQRQQVELVARALTTKTSDGGIYSDFGSHGGIVWQEVATPGKNSNIINGHAAALYTIAHEAPRLSNFPEVQHRLEAMVKQGKTALVEMLPTMVPEPGKILYDTNGIGVREKGHYSHLLIVSVLKWMQSLGDVSAAEVQRIIDLKPASSTE
jgi:hypothetical protein